MADAPMTVVETEEFLRKAKPLMSDADREEMVAFLAGDWPEEASVAALG